MSRVMLSFLRSIGRFIILCLSDLAHFFGQLFIVLVKVSWLSLKLCIKYGIIAFYYLTRLLTWPFRKCFPPKNLNNMSGLDFERFTAKWLSLNGYRSIKTTPPTGDYGVDILAKKDNVPIAVQCKRYSGKVGVAAIQEITAGLPFYDCKKGLVVTNSEFTKSAQELALSNGIELIDGKQIMKTKAAKMLIKSTFSILVSTFIMSILLVLSFGLNVWVLFRAQKVFPLTLMFFCICLLSFINGFYELKERKKKPRKEKETDSVEALNVPFEVD